MEPIKKILIVDDSASVRQMEGFTMRNAGFDVHEAVDGLDAVEKMMGRRFDLIICDTDMPNVDGYEFLATIKLREEWKSIPFLFLTTEDSDEYKLIGKRLGANGWCVKPFDPAKLGLGLINYSQKATMEAKNTAAMKV